MVLNLRTTVRTEPNLKSWFRWLIFIKIEVVDNHLSLLCGKVISSILCEDTFCTALDLEERKCAGHTCRSVNKTRKSTITGLFLEPNKRPMMVDCRFSTMHILFDNIWFQI